MAGITLGILAAYYGDAPEAGQKHLDTGSGWPEADARSAFALLAWSGGGWVVGAVVASLALGVS